MLSVHLVGSVSQYLLIASPLTNSMRYRMSRQIVPANPYSNDPPQWLDALKDAVSSGAIRNIRLLP